MAPLDEQIPTSIADSPIAAVVTDPRQDDNPIVAANAAFCRLTGYSEAEVVGRNCRFLAGPETEAQQTDRIRNALGLRIPVVAEMVNYRKDGSTFRNAVMIAPLFADDGSLRYFLGSQMEIVGDSDGAHERRRRARMVIDALTPRQTQVVRLMATGLRNKQIAARLGVSEKTVKMHRSLLLRKLDVRSSAEAVRMVVEAEN